MRHPVYSRCVLLTFLLACGTAAAEGPPVSMASIIVSVHLDASPTCDTVTPTTPSPTNSSTVSFSVGFSEDVQNFDDGETDLVITETGTVDHTGTSIAGGPQTYTVDVTGVSGEGTMTLAVSTTSDVQDMATNTLASSVTSSAVIIDSTIKWVDFGFTGDEMGTESNPFNTLQEATDVLTEGGTIKVKGNTGKNWTSETPRITTPMRIEAVNGTVIIGAPGAQGAPQPGPVAYGGASSPVGAREAGRAGEDGLAELLGALRAVLAQGTSEDSEGIEDESTTSGERTVYEPAVPFTTSGDGLRSAQADSVLAIRLRSEAEIDPESIWGPVPNYTEDEVTAAWQPVVEGDLRDVWVIFRPTETWYLDEVISLTVGAETVSGEPVEPVTFRFQTESEGEYFERVTEPVEPVWQPQYDEDFDAAGLDLTSESSDTAVVMPAGQETTSIPLSEGLAAPFTIRPERVYEIPQRVWLPVPQDVDPTAVQLYYYHPTGDDRGWYPAENVQGWLVPDSYLTLELDDVTYLGFLVRHAGIVQLGIPPRNQRDRGSL